MARGPRCCQFIGRNDHPDAQRQEGIIATEVRTKSDRMTMEYRRVLASLAAETGGAKPDSAWRRL